MNDPEQVLSRWVKHLYRLVEELNDTQTEMTGMKPSDEIKLNEVPLVHRENYTPEEKLPEDGLYRYLLQNLVKNTMIDDAEQQIEYGQREPTDCEKSLKMQAIV